MVLAKNWWVLVFFNFLGGFDVFFAVLVRFCWFLLVLGGFLVVCGGSL